MLDQLPRILTPFIIALFQIFTAALTLGMIPALWHIARRKQYAMLVRWSVFFLLVAAAAGYGLPKAMIEWRAWVTEPAFKRTGMYIGYFVGVLFAFFIIPEPRRLAHLRLRHRRGSHHEAPAETEVRVRRVRRRRSRSGHSAE